MTLTSDMLLAKIKSVFINQDKYYFDKHVPEFMHNDKFLGDCYSIVIVESKESNPPRFYHTFSPFDTISGKAPDQALVFENGKMLLNTNFADYVVMRTGAMDSAVLQAIGVDSLVGKKVLYIGSGKIAQASVQILKSQFEELVEVDCANQSGNFDAINKIAKELKVEVRVSDLKDISEYDFIFCHTSAKESVLTKEMLSEIKHGAIVTSFISSTQHGEVSDEYFDTKNANIICDWDKTLTEAKDLSRAVEKGLVQKEEVVLLRNLFDNSKSINSSKNYTIYRSTGTPLQNLAVLQLLIDRDQ